jgi:hypothetical protein
MKTDFKKKSIVLIGLWLACCMPSVLLYIMAVAPQNKILKQLKLQVAEKTETYTFLKGAKGQGQQAKINTDFEDLRQYFSDFVLSGNDLSNLDLMLGQISLKNRFDSFSSKSMDDLKNDKVDNFKYIGERRLKLSFLTDFRSLCTFVNELERHQPIIFIDQFSLTSDSTNDSLPLAGMELAVFFEKQEPKNI